MKRYKTLISKKEAMLGLASYKGTSRAALAVTTFQLGLYVKRLFYISSGIPHLTRRASGIENILNTTYRIN